MPLAPIDWQQAYMITLAVSDRESRTQRAPEDVQRARGRRLARRALQSDTMVNAAAETGETEPAQEFSPSPLAAHPRDMAAARRDGDRRHRGERRQSDRRGAGRREPQREPTNGHRGRHVDFVA